MIYLKMKIITFSILLHLGRFFVPIFSSNFVFKFIRKIILLAKVEPYYGLKKQNFKIGYGCDQIK